MNLNKIETDYRDFIGGFVLGAVIMGIGGFLTGCILMEWVLWK